MHESLPVDHRDGNRVRSYDVPGAWNFRRAGATGQLYRSSTLSLLDSAGEQRLEDLGIRTVFDLRYAREIELAGVDRVPSSIVVRNTPFGPNKTVMPLHDVPAMRSDGERFDYMIASYRLFPRLTDAASAIVEVAKAAARAEVGGVLVHCAAGKDRTGWVCAAVLAAAGASRDEIMNDYMRSNDSVDDLRASSAMPPPESDHSPLLLGVRPEYLDAAFDEVRSRHGSIDRYLADIGIRSSLRQSLAAQRSVRTPYEHR